MTRTKQNWLDSIRKFKTEAGAREDRFATEAQLWQAHEAAKLSATAVLEDTAHLVASMSRERTTVDALTETVRGARSRSEELKESQNRVSEAFDRLRLVALNLGLEGARLSDPAGKSLISVADEVRVQADRGNEALNELRNLHNEILPSLARVDDRIGQLRQSESQVGDQLARIQENAQQVSRQVDEILVWAQKLSETDPDTARIVARAIENARGLLSALSALREKAQLDFAMSALRPILIPLAALISDLGTNAKTKKE